MFIKANKINGIFMILSFSPPKYLFDNQAIRMNQSGRNPAIFLPVKQKAAEFSLNRYRDSTHPCSNKISQLVSFTLQHGATAYQQRI
jgi:hypothetical protein